MEDKRKALYNALSGEYDLGTYEDFTAKLNDESKRRALYDAAGQDYNLGTYEEYSEKLGFGPSGSNVVPMFDDEPQATPAQENVEENSRKLRGLWANFKESSKGLWAGIKGYAGEQLNMFTGSSREEQAALNDIERLEEQGVDVIQYLADKEDAEFQESYGMSKDEFMALDKKERKKLVRQASKIMPDQQTMMSDAELKEQRRQQTNQQAVEDAFYKALEMAGGDLTKAKAILREQAADKTRGDILIEEATETMNNLRQPEGFAGWVGNLLPQMVPAAASIAINYLTKGKASGLSKALGYGTMGGLTLSTAGMSMLEARNAGATNLEVWTTGIADGAIEIISEKIPFDRVTKRVFSSAKANVAEKLGDAVLTPKGRKELEKLLSDANEKLGGKLFSKKNVGEWLTDTVYEAAGEFTAEALQTITTMIYENPEDYPTISEVLANGWEGAKAGLFMGSVTGGSSLAASHAMNKDRRQAQGYVDVAQIENENGDVEVVEVVGENPEDGTITILHGDTVENVSRDKIGDRFRFSYEEFENGRLRSREDDAIDNGVVNDGQIRGMEETIQRDLEELQNFFTAEEINQIASGTIPANASAEGVAAARRYMDDVQRTDDLHAAKAEQDQKRKDACRDRIESEVGQRFWIQEEGEDDGSGVVPVTETVEEVVYADGRVGYVVGSDEAGNLTMVYNDGSRGFSTRAEIAEKESSGEILSNTVMGLDDYLAVKVDIEDVTAEAARMEEEQTANVQSVQAAHPVGSTINVGTAEAKVEVPIIAVNADGAIVQMPDGTTPQLTWADIAHAEGQEVKPKTNAELDQEVVDEYKVAYQPAVKTGQEPSFTEREVEVEQTTPANPLPLKADGSVDQTALWNNDPERWAQWNDEQRQDGGANSLAYVSGAIAKEQAKIAELQAAYAAESDFDARDVIEKEIADTQARVERLGAIRRGYIATAETAPVVEAEPAAPRRAQQMREQEIEELNSRNERRLRVTSDEEDRAKIIESYLDKISEGSVPIVYLTVDNYEEVMKKNGCGPRTIASVKYAVDHGKRVGGFMSNDRVFIMTANISSIEEARVTYVHERQHVFTRSSDIVERILATGVKYEELQEWVRKFAKDDFYDSFGPEVLADELVSFAMEKAYTYEDFSVALQELGVDESIIAIIKSINDEQQFSESLSQARRRERLHPHADGNYQRGSSAYEGNSTEISSRLLGQQDDGTAGDGYGRARFGEEGEGAEVTPEGPSFRVTSEMDASYRNAIEQGDEEIAQQMVNAAAEEWAKESKVRDEHGNLAVQYHGSRDFGFTVFNTDPKTQNLGSHFGSAEAARVFDGKGDRTYKVFLNITNPWVPRYEDFWTDEDQVYAAAVADLANDLAQAGNEEAAKIYDEIVAEYPMARNDETLNEWFIQEHRGDTYTGAETLHPKLRRLLEIGGYDGVQYNNWVEDPGHDSWVALYPEQIKSAESATFDDDNKLIPLSERFTEGVDLRFRTAATNPEVNLTEETRKELADKGLVMDGGAIMSEDYAVLKHALGYETPIERNTDLDQVRFSVGTKNAHIANYRKHPNFEERVVEILERLAERMTMNELVYGVVSTATQHTYGKKLPGSVAGPLRSNEEYIITFDLDTSCPRTFQYLNLVKQIEKRIGRPLTQVESIQLIEMMRMYGQQIPCVYCYAENKRQALKQYYTDFMEARHGVLSAASDEEALQYMYGRVKDSKDPREALTKAAYEVFVEWRKNPRGMYNPTIKMMWNQYTNDRNSILSLLDRMYADKAIGTSTSDTKITGYVAAEFGVTNAKALRVIEEVVAEWKWDVIEEKEHDQYTPVDEDDWGVNERALEVWRDMTSYAKSASSAKSVIRYTPYTDELKAISQEDKDYINGMGGVRMHSSNDFRIDYVFDYFQFMADMALYKMFGHTYTKSPEFVRIFGNSGYKINMSIAAYQDENGNIRPNADEGFDWEEAKTLRQLFPNAGTMLMATSDEQIQMALDSDWIDMCIPFHHSGLPKAVWYNMRMWQDYTSIQKELFLNSSEMKEALKADGVMIPKNAKADDIAKLYNDHFGIKVLYDKKGKRIRPHFLPGPTVVDGHPIPGHSNDHQRYLDLCKEYGVKPRFAGMQVRDNSPEGGGRVIDVTEHPRYMIFIKETSRTDSPQTPIQFNFDQPSEALGGKSPIDYAFDELEARAMAESEIEGKAVNDIYNSLKKDQFGIADQFINSIIKHKNETGEDYPLDYITPESRDWFLVQRKALEEAFKDVETIPYHRNEYDEQGNIVQSQNEMAASEPKPSPIDLIEEAKKSVENDVMFRFIGEQAAINFDRAQQSYELMNNLEVAREMLQQDVDARKIKAATGWEMGADGRWRLERPDFEFKAKPGKKKTFKLSELIEDTSLFAEYPQLKNIKVRYKKLPKELAGEVAQENGEDIIFINEENYRAYNPTYEQAIDEFTKMYPEIANLISRGKAGSLTAEQRKIFMDMMGPVLALERPYIEEMGGRNTLAHEIQHLIQKYEGFAEGGSEDMTDTTDPNDAKRVQELRRMLSVEIDIVNDMVGDLNDMLRRGRAFEAAGNRESSIALKTVFDKKKREYQVHMDNVNYLKKELRKFKTLGAEGYKKLAGEVEARNVEKRLNMTAEERRQSLYSDTQDVATEDQIFLRNNLMTTYASEALIPGHKKGQPMLSDAEMMADVSFRITPEQDKAYMDAVEAGDMDAAQAMVYSAAQATGYNSPRLYHGTDAEFTTFDKEFNDPGSEGFFFTNSEEMAASYGKNIKQVYLHVEDPYVIEGNGRNWNQLHTDIFSVIPEIEDQIRVHEIAMKSFLDRGKISQEQYDHFREKYYDKVNFIKDESKDSIFDIIKKYIYRWQIRNFKSMLNVERTRDFEWFLQQLDSDVNIIFKNITDFGPNSADFYIARDVAHDVYVTTNPKNIKSADPVTYDDEGKVVPLSERFNPESSDIRFRTMRTDEQREQLFDNAKEKFGLTNNFKVAGYMLPDGSLLDFSEANDGGDPNQRTQDHREVADLIMDEGREYEYRYEYVLDFVGEGAIRMLPEYAGFQLSVPPTAEQRSRLMDYIYKHNGEVIMEITDENGGPRVYMEYNKRTSPSRIFRDMDGFFNEGVVPGIPPLRFRIANENQEIFVSNAAKAVEGIKQEKATPEQWLKMIEKNGGLKAGEDKWMGLSDFLKSSDKKTLTKQEVLDFINENMIVIEETHYTADAEDDAASRHDLLEQRVNERYKEILNSLQDIEDYDERRFKAFNLLQEELGEFADNVDLERYGVYLTFPYEDLADYIEFADMFGVDIKLDNPIHDTRLAYTTPGLDNHREIALTVPTIEPWNKHDDLHFGDAGNGRAVAWIRFGETTDEAGNNILVIDEIQSKRHQEGRDKGYADIRDRRIVDAAYEEYIAKEKEAENYKQSLDDKYGIPTTLKSPNATKEEIKRLKQLRSEAKALREKWFDAKDNAKNLYGIPDAPFDKNWHELAMKRMLRYAAENGYDVVAWTKGDQQIERYDLAHHIKRIHVYRPTQSENRVISLYYRHEYDDYMQLIVNPEGRIISGHAEGSQLADVVGKEMALKIMESEEITLQGDGLRVGGEGMRGFYDKMLPAFMNKYGKKWGIKVEDIELPNLKNGLTMHSVPVTEEMKASVMEGQVMFRTIPITQEVQDEMDAISATAIVRGNYLKAPNGADTNLTPEQWAMVRTNAFMDWFGDWEFAAQLVDVVSGTIEHGFANFDEARDWARNNIVRTYSNAETGQKGVIEISNNAIKKYLSDSAVKKSDSKDLHLAVLKYLPEIIRTGVIAETHADHIKNENGERTPDSPINPDVKIHRVFGAVEMNGNVYRVKVTIKEHKDNNRANTSHSYEATKIELLAGTLVGANSSNSNTNNSITVANLLENVDKSYEKGKILDYSKVVDENGEPLVIWRGMSWDIMAEAEGDAVMNPASYFSNEAYVSRKFGEYAYPYFMNARNPYIMNAGASSWSNIPIEYAEGLEVEPYDEEYPDETGIGDIATAAFAKGYDAVWVRDVEDMGGVADQLLNIRPNQIKAADDNTGEFSKENDDIRFKVVTDPAKIEELEDGPKVEAYRAVQIDKNGKIYSPMASRLKSTKKGTKQATNEAAQMNQWDQAVESLDKVDENGRITILDEDGGTTKVAYNPYGHCCVNSMMNDQFKRAWERDGLYVMKVLAPESELTAGYHAEKAKDAVGIHKWKTGAVGNKLPENKRREILLTRWMKNVKVMPWEEVAQDWIKTLEGENVDVPFNVVPRKILNMLAEAGVKIVAPEKGMENATKAYEQWLADPEGYVGNTELPDYVKALNEETDDEGPDNEPRFRITGTPTDEVVADGLDLTPAQTAEVAANIFAALPEESRKKITEGLNGNVLGLKDAILQIPTSLASKENWTDEDKQMADVVAEEMTKIAGEMTRPFSAEEGLWLLYNNLNKGTDLISQASRALVQRNLGFDAETLAKQEQAKEDVRFRTVGDATSNAQASLYNRGAVNVWTRLKESFVDMQASVEELVKAIEKRTGKVAQGFENILLALNQQSSKGLAAMESYTQKFLNPMFDEIRRIMDETKMKYEDVVRYVILKHGLERNKKLAQRDARAHYQEIYDDIISKITGMTAAQKRTYLTNAQLKEGDAKAELATLQAVDMSAMTDEEKREHKKKLAAARKAVEEAEEHLKRAQKIASLSEQEAQDELDKIFEKIENGTDSVFKEMRENDYSGISSMFYDQLGVDRKNFSTEEQYQVALMEAKKDRYSSLKDIEAAAEAEVKSFEGKTDTKELWKRINAATKETLRQQYEANMISKDQYLNLRDMFEYYVPLRGFKDNTAEDMYTYYRKPNSTGYTKPILGAEGRKTEAESPFGWIAAMAGSAIASNVKNEAKLALFYFVSNRPENGIATISKTWFVDSGEVDERGKKIFKPAYPPFSEDLSSDAAKANYEAWQENMRELQKKGQAYEAGQRLNLGNAVVNISDANKPEHIVNVKVGGKDYTIIINGNPRAAQAINGDLNIEGTAQDYSALFGPILRWMSSVNTSYNPEFWITNMMRDMAFTMMAVNIKEDSAYRRKFSKNYRKAFKAISLVAKNENGTIGDSYLEQQYKDFVKYGGVTGYTQIKDSETWEQEIENYLSSNDPKSVKNGKVMRGVKSAFHAAHRFGESLEQVSRFAAFLTARETGKSINEAINDAKEITVNFNRKGSGKMITLEEAKYLTGKDGQPLTKPQQWMVVGLSSIAPLGRRFIMFFNAAIQGLNATYKLMKKNPKRFTGWALGYAAVGMMNAVLHAMLDDDDDYLDIPQYERRNSLMIGGNGAYFKWALPQEARAFYALGDLAVETVMGRNPHQNFLGEALKIGTEILPVNPSEGWKAFMPSVAIPFIELALNEDYKGAPIYNEQKWLSEEEKERTAKWSNAYQGTGWTYVKITQGLNFITGGDKHDAGWINLQPEKLEHLVQSAFGGTIRTADKFINTISAALDPEEPMTIRQTPFLNRFLTINDERFKNVHVNDVFDYYKADAEHALTLEKQYIKDRDMDSLTELRSSDEYQWAKIYGKYKKPLKAIQDKIKVADGTAEKKELMKQQDELKKRMIKEISEL